MMWGNTLNPPVWWCDPWLIKTNITTLCSAYSRNTAGMTVKAGWAGGVSIQYTTKKIIAKRCYHVHVPASWLIACEAPDAFPVVASLRPIFRRERSDDRKCVWSDDRKCVWRFAGYLAERSKKKFWCRITITMTYNLILFITFLLLIISTILLVAKTWLDRAHLTIFSHGYK